VRPTLKEIRDRLGSFAKALLMLRFAILSRKTSPTTSRGSSCIPQFQQPAFDAADVFWVLSDARLALNTCWLTVARRTALRTGFRHRDLYAERICGLFSLRLPHTLRSASLSRRSPESIPRNSCGLHGMTWSVVAGTSRSRRNRQNRSAGWYRSCRILLHGFA